MSHVCSCPPAKAKPKQLSDCSEICEACGGWYTIIAPTKEQWDATEKLYEAEVARIRKEAA